MNCTYCECGRTHVLTDERRDYVPTAEVIAELRAALDAGPPLDSITFSGSGEPTLHSGIGEIIAFLKREYPQYRVTVITNSSLLHLPEVRAALMPADRVMPSLDAVTQDAFRHVNRPHTNIMLPKVVQGLRDFCREYMGEVWLEIFIVPGVNDTDVELDAFREVLGHLRVSRIQLNTLDRAGAEDLEPASLERLEEIARFLGPAVEVIASRRTPAAASTPDALAGLAQHTLALDALTAGELALRLGIPADRADAIITALLRDGQVQREETGGRVVYRGSATVGA